ncbi:hypothetical protein Tco_1485159 [Tanacetum coccineum]
MEKAMLLRVYHEFLLWGSSNRAAKSRYNTNLARLLPKQIYSPIIMDWDVLNNMGCAEEIEAMLEMKFDEVVTNDELMTKKLIKFRLCGRGHTLTLLEFSRRLSLYHSDEINDEGFEVYFQALDGTTLRELISLDERLIAEDPSPEVPRVAMPKGPRPSMQDLYDRIGMLDFLSTWLDNISFHCKEIMHHLAMMRRMRISVEMTQVDLE